MSNKSYLPSTCHRHAGAYCFLTLSETSRIRCPISYVEYPEGVQPYCGQ